MPLRPVIFWVHMVVGVSTGLIILLLSSTGVLLSYEKETLGWSGHRFVEQAAPPSGARLPLNALIASAKEANGDASPSSQSNNRARDYRRYHNRICLPGCGGSISLVSSRADLVQDRAEGQSQKLELAQCFRILDRDSFVSGCAVRSRDLVRLGD